MKQTNSFPTTIGEIFATAVYQFSDEPAIVCGDLKFSYVEFRARVLRMAGVFSKMNCTKGDRIAIVHKNCHYFQEAYFAAAVSNIVLVPVNFRLSAQEISFIIEDSGAKAVILGEEFSEKLTGAENQKGLKVFYTGSENQSFERKNWLAMEEAMYSINPEKVLIQPCEETDIAQIYYTSGTTGRPKGVQLSNKNICTHTIHVIKELKLVNPDIWLHISPMFHLADAWAVWAITAVGGTHVMQPDFDEEKVFQLIEKERITLSNLIPTLLNLMVKHTTISNYKYDSLRMILSGGASIAPEVVRQVIALFGCEYVQTYGMTETSPFLTMSLLSPEIHKLPFEEKFKFIITTGRPFSAVQLKVIEADGTEVEHNDIAVGEIIAKGETVTPGYWNLEEETQTKIKDGWLHTGDLAKINAEGYLTIVDRKNDMIITGGENVYSIEVENAIYAHESVLEAAVVGIADPVWGEKIVAFVVLKDGFLKTEAPLSDHCKLKLAGFKCPKEIKYVDQIPKTGSGKISKKLLREMY